LFHRGLGDDELRSDRTDRRRLGERITCQQGTAQRHEHIAFTRRQWWRVGDRRRLLPACGAVEEQAEAAEEELVRRAENTLANDPCSVHEGAVARSEVADTPRVTESLKHGVYTGHSVGVHDQFVRLEGPDSHALGV